MTERTWHSSASGVKLIQHLSDRITDRKARLLMLACCRRHEARFTRPVLREALDAIAAHYADPTAPEVPFNGEGYTRLYRTIDRYTGANTDAPDFYVGCGVLVAVEPLSIARRRKHALDWRLDSCLLDSAREGAGEQIKGEQKAQAALVREVFGNPFRPVAFDPAWRTDTVLALARQMYTSEDFSAAPILADALQDAGCGADALLNHLRDARATHVRGCWAPDLVLGLS